ncbi:hypothetical protein B6A27_12190 [Anoxybacillus sp. UARK-01]|uniref:phosphotransferase n=1 Tax=Anoxybacillus sp. UARK-01 TaxID=1895648 RepID=UPI0009B9DB89|nr:phosphotransferase [Anoxybacillus sp. UARK-01]OQM44809.1 hypothetical protein B6A27_12190 [Anoxybacillus sp. UARK-01]
MGKAATTKNSHIGDGESHRLFLLLQAEYGLCVEEAAAIKPHVQIIDTNKGKWIVKKYRTFFEASRQQMFIHLLKQAGFQAAPSITGVAVSENACWTLQEYIPHSNPFVFTSEKDRNEGLCLLYEYHIFSQRLLQQPFFATMLPYYQLCERWKQRYLSFLHDLPVWQQIMRHEELTFILQCAQYSLEKIPLFIPSLLAEPMTIIHGDVASHNFLRAENGSAYLIDYDLIAVAPSGIDYLQYANRILPYMQWSFALLKKCPILEDFLEKPWFLMALIFPSDIFRECRSFMKKRKPFAIPYFEHRKQFVQKIANMIR